ncbi:response regulator [Komarekiella sp. 'clone 1']|uniref:histidine kinase n=1 Tax=Komarekiella delphini-convector SJRDD-AB1 TaxID=2593771 RepID=A0AA40VSX9_9NOST|nr:response regulator [Komarekiella delphini-convector]MBD6618630.1 response regulator [Komarekiella delphini-convector SJRDD-AB1]
MLPEQQQRILGYFIEEARDHLNTIEQGLLNLESTLNDPEMINEVFRAAHSIKGGAAMLGLTSIQHTSHRLEDCFKVLKEHPVKVDEKLESLFLGVSDTLKVLLEHLSGPFGLSEDAANTLMSETEPVFQWLNQHLELLVEQGNSVASSTTAPEKHSASTDNLSTLTELFLRRDIPSLPEDARKESTDISFSVAPQEVNSSFAIASSKEKTLGQSNASGHGESALSPAAATTDSLSEFQAHVLQTLREMLQLFKQTTTPETRQNLQQCCHQLVRLGAAQNLSNWCGLCQAAASAIGNSENTYLTLAKIVITEIKQAQELVLQGREAEIVISQQLEVLLSLAEIELLEITPDLADEQSAVLTELSITPEPILFVNTFDTTDHAEQLAPPTVMPLQDSITSLSELTEQLNLDEDTGDRYANVFEEDASVELQATSENVATQTNLSINSLSAHEDEIHPLNSNIDPNGPEVGIAELNTLADLFEGETPDLDETWQQEEILEIVATNELGINFSHSDIENEDADSDLSDLLSFDEDSSNEQHPTTTIQTEDLSLLFGDNFLDKENQESQNQQTPSTTVEFSNIATFNINLDASPSDILQEFTEISGDLEQFPAETRNSANENEVIEDLLLQALDDEPLLASEVNQPVVETIASIELSTNQQNSFDELFLETGHADWVEEITPNDYIESPTLSEPGLSLENLFTQTEEYTLPSKGELELSDLFDTPSITPSELSYSEDDLSTFWNPEITAEQQHEFDSVVEQDVAKALEESLFSTAANDIFADSQQSIPASFDLEDFDITFQQRQQQDMLFSLDAEDDLFEDLASNNSASPTREDSVQPSALESSDRTELASLRESVTPKEIRSLSQEPEALDVIPEFTNQSTEISSVDSLKAFTDLEISSDTFDDNTDENSQLLSEDVADLTYIQIETTDNIENDLSFTAASLDISFGEISDLASSQTQPSNLFETFDDNTDENSQLLSEDVADLTYIQIETTDNIENDLSFSAATNQEESIENLENTANVDSQVVNDFTQTVIQEPIVADLNELNLETDENLEADFSEHVWDSEETNEPAIVNEAENAIVTSIEELQVTSTEAAALKNDIPALDEFADLEALLGQEVAPSLNATSIPEMDFAALEALLGEDNDETAAISSYQQSFRTQPVLIPSVNTVSLPRIEDEFGDLEKLLAEADQTISHSSIVKSNTGKTPRPSTRRAARFEETMKVPVKQLDDMSNLVGEMVVNRNTLEQDHERLRQALDNLLIQVQQLSDVGARMQELYERSLLEASLLAGRKTKDSGISSQDSNSDRGFSELEMDRFTPFHTLSQQMIERIVRVRESASDIDFVTEETERVARQFRQVTTQLQEGLTRARMVPFAQTIDRWRRGVRDNAIKCGKQVELVIEGGDTLIDKMILDHLTDPLTHMLNNAIAHGIETPDERQAIGKPPVGIITIRAFHQGNQTIISVGDDGAGIDSERVKSKAVKIGMITEAQAKTISRVEVYDLLFQSGFTIKDQADEISGRGVGMDVVRSEISEIRGTVNTDSTLGKGTTFTIRLPLTLSICKALCCVSDKARIAFPMDGVEDTLDIPLKNIQHNANGESFISWRDTLLPFRPLKELLTFNRQISRGNVYGGNRDDDMVSVIVVRSASTLIALQIDLVLSEQEIVIKQFEGPAPKPIGVAGATVLGDGRIMPIADVLEIIDIFQGRISTQAGGSSWQQKATPIDPPAVKIDPTVLIVDDSITVRELLSLTFNKAGYRVEQARDGQEAWDKLRSGLPCDIVFCDIEMPRCDGLELLSRIQKDSNLNHLPIAMLTSRGADKHRQMAVQLGASGYFTKPYLEEALLEAAARMLKGEKLVNSASNA